MISRDTKVGRMLKDHPQTLDVLLSASEHFGKLQNPLLRRTLAPRVSIEQAAKIAGVNLGDLLQKLNQAIGASSQIVENANDSSDSRSQAKRPDILDRLEPIELDVRPILQGGVDPLKTILRTVELLAPGQYLRLINNFEPIPLYTVLDKRGFAHYTEYRQGIFHVHFYCHSQEKHALEAGNGVARPIADAAVPARGTTVEIDVRQLAPPEPMMRILEALSRVDGQTMLLVHHHREPLLLYEKLQTRGFKWDLTKIEEGYFHLRVWKEENQASRTSDKQNGTTTNQMLDVRPLAPAKRHSLIFQTFEALPPDGSFVLVNDHDPKPLYYQFKFEHENQFVWEYLEQGPEVWKVTIGKVGNTPS